MNSAILRDDHRSLPVGPREAFGRPAVGIAIAKTAPPAVRLDLYRLTASLFGLAVYLVLPIGGLIYLGLEIGKTLGSF